MTNWIQTYTGKRIEFDDPQTDQIDIEDIARGLGNECRFGGQTARFYSVAQHSLVVCDAVRAAGGDVAVQRQALLHDAPEAYIGDVQSPLKAQIGRPYTELEEMLWWRICDRFDIAPKLSDLVLLADAAVLTLEKRELLPNAQPWPTDIEWPLALGRESPLVAVGMPPRVSGSVFLGRFRMLEV